MKDTYIKFGLAGVVVVFALGFGYHFGKPSVVAEVEATKASEKKLYQACEEATIAKYSAVACLGKPDFLSEMRRLIARRCHAKHELTDAYLRSEGCRIAKEN